MPLIRAFHIYLLIIRYRIDNILWKLPPPHPLGLRFLKILFPGRWFQSPKAPTPLEIRDALVELGPIFIKFGQILSTRQDILPIDFGQALATLQDKVPSFETSIAIEIIEKTYGQSIEKVFKEFNPIPLAAASIAQVYCAQLPSGEDVVIKLLRPGIDKAIRQDIKLMRAFAAILNKIPALKRYKPLEVVEEFEKTLALELNLMNEAANASVLKRYFKHSRDLYVPKIYWDYARPHVLVMERIYGISVGNLTALKAAGMDMKKLAERGVDIFFTQVFRDSFFHADMHPGNIFVCDKNPSDPKYIAVDFGIMGMLTPHDQHYLAQNFLAFFKRDYREIAQLHIDSGWVAKDVRLTELETAIQTVCEPLFERPLKDISFGAALLALFQTAHRFNMQVQPQLLLLQKTLIGVEGLGKQLYPELNLWESAQPFLEKWLRKQMTPAMRFKFFMLKLKNHLPQWLDKVLDSIDN